MECIYEEINSTLNSGMLATAGQKTFCLPLCYPTTYRLNNIYSTIILSVILHGCETWSLTLREDIN